MDSEPVRDHHDVRLILMRHYAKLRDHPVLSQSRFVFVPENNLGMQGTLLESMVKDMHDVTVYCHKPDRPGVWKTEAITRSYQFMLANALATKTLHFDAALFTVTKNHTPKSMLDLAERQLRQLHWDTRTLTNGESRARITGKVGNLPDDLCITICMAVYWGHVITVRFMEGNRS